jgi:MFS transporter, DHA2 family, multidrug resistance protein
LQLLLLFRLLQGFAGGGMVPVAQSILADAFPQEKRGQAFAVFGVAVVVAPIVGPTLGGWLSDNWSWHWCFLINGPVGLLAIAMIALNVRDSAAAVEQRRQWRQQGGGFDFVGFALVATFLGALEIVLDRGLEDNWFGSSFIIATSVFGGLAFVLMIPWEITRRDPAVDIRMLASRQLGASFLVLGATGAILLATTQYLPQFVQKDLGYTATWAGILISPGGAVTMVMMFVTGRLVAKIQPKYLIAAGAVIIALSMYGLTAVYGDIGFWYMASCRMLFGVGFPLVFVSITTVSYQGIRPDKTGQAAALINVARNTGGSIGVSLISNVLWDRQQFHQSRLVEHAIPSSVQYQDTLHQMTSYFLGQGSLPPQAQQEAINWIGQQLQLQASFLSYMDAFWVLALIALAAAPVGLALRKASLGRAAAGGH